VLALLAAGTPAQAHVMNTGFGPFYDGLTHPLVTPEDLLPVVALHTGVTEVMAGFLTLLVQQHRKSLRLRRRAFLL
jgi:hypothetical protein